MRSSLILLAAILLTTACSFDPFGLEGDSTEGDEGNSRWSLQDGLCPGWGQCDLSVPVARGAQVAVQIEVPGRTLAEISPVLVDELSGTVTRVSRDPELETIDFEVLLVRAGTIELMLVDPDGEVIDRARIDVREPVGLACGEQDSSEPLDYAMDTIMEDSREIGIVRGAEGQTAPMLACRVTDGEGTPLLSVDIVDWHVVEAPELLVLQSSFLDFVPDPFADGARIWVNTLEDAGTGTAVIEASVSDMTETFTVTVE